LTEHVEIICVANNIGRSKNLRQSWGLSFWINTHGHKVLFDTCDNGNVLLGNIKSLGLSPETLSAIVISHPHWDHVGGLSTITKLIALQTPIFVPGSATGVIASEILNGVVVGADSPKQVVDDIYVTGEIMGKYSGMPMPEQGMVIKTSRGLIILAGCSHPGIENIVKKASSLFPDERIHLVAGGFHLLDKTRDEIEETIEKLINIGVESIAPSHCTGALAIELMRQRWGEKFVKLALGDRFMA